MAHKTVSAVVITLCLLTFSAVSTAYCDQNQNNPPGPHHCRVSPPAEWTGRTLSWEGACRDGKADGEGVLRGYKKGKRTLIFFGRVERGEVSLGVIENADGYIAGPFSGGKPVPNPERNSIIKAFEKASAAARAFSEHLRKKGNKESADFYLKKAEELEQQMD